ncbi:MAG: hypothetical protein H6834_08990 [Planctomycetes bacterium]|nr:hypothetical protein [Planctomycetota bacterium]
MPEPRLDAITWLHRYRSSFDDDEFIRHVRRALADPDERVLEQALLTARRLDLRTLLPQVLAVFRRTLRDTGRHELTALTLGCFESTELSALLADHEVTPAIAVALALVGHPEHLARLPFESPRAIPYWIREALIDGVLHNEGRYGLEWLIRSGEAFVSVRSMLIEHGAPARGELQLATGPDDLVRWFEAHGAAYVERARSRPRVR